MFPPARLELHRNGNRPAVILDQKKNRKFAQASGIQAFEKFPFAGGTIAAGNVYNFVGLVAHMFAKRRLLAPAPARAETSQNKARPPPCRPLACTACPLTKTRKNIQPRNAPVRRHLPPAGIRIVLGPHGLKKHFQWRDAQRQAKRAVAIVGIDPIVAGPENKSRGGQYAFMPRAADLEIGLVLAFQLDFAVVDAPRKIHDAVNTKKIPP